MKKIIILFSLLTTSTLQAQDIIGPWYGILEVRGTQLRVVFHINKTENGYNSTMDSPDQGAKGIPVTSTTFKSPILKLEIKNLKVEYEGELKEKNITGTFTQAGKVFPMDLSREPVKKKIVVRPQEPVKPYPYHTEEVKFKNKKDNIVLAGTLSIPMDKNNCPVVVLISGSGPQNRDEELMGHKPFLVLSDHLTKNGIAVLRFDDRGIGKSKGDFKTATTVNFASDVEAAVEYLKTRKEIDKNKIGLIGHSEGGMIAPMVAAKSADINFIVLLAGTGIPGDEILLLQSEMIGKAAGMDGAALQKSIAVNKGAFDIVKKSAKPETIKVELTNYLKTALKDNPKSGKPANMSEDDFIKLQVEPFLSPWMQYFIKYDPATNLEKVKCPVLALNGEKDMQVPSKVNLEAIKTSLEKGGNKNVTTKELPGLNHLFQECETGAPAEYDKIEQTFSPIALSEVSTWILTQVK
jgi:pimeloyl-ACP methyl ester carboxylesterase